MIKLIVPILHQIFNIINLKNDNPPIKVFVNNTENRITSKIKTVYYLERLTSEAMKQRGTENVSHLETTEVVLVRSNIVNNDYQLNSRVFYTFVPNKSFGQVLDISPKTKNIFKIF